VIVYPAIDIIDGKCVRLSRGDYSKKTIYSDNLESVVSSWLNKGNKFLHIVDLDGAKAGSPTNIDSILNIRNSFPDIFIQIGGGIRDVETVEKYLSNGIDRIILGTKVLKDRDFILSIDQAERKSLAIDIAIKDGQLAGDGWETTAKNDVGNFIEFFEQNGIERFVVTDIKQDGMMQGINTESIMTALKFISTKAIISGGVTSIEDIQSIISMSPSKIDGFIIGKALYENAIDLEEAISECS
tara:strand:+ start:1388 stop:2113 length:726 start_codon:yes stop_codon:yes gene_type:complete